MVPGVSRLLWKMVMIGVVVCDQGRVSGEPLGWLSCVYMDMVVC